MNKGDFKGQNNSIGESEVDNKVITVGSSQGHRALVIAVVVVLLGVVYYFYFRPSHKENQELVDKKEIKIDMHELKNKLEKVPDEVPAPERIMVNPLPPLPEIVMPQHIPEVKTEVKKTATTEKKEVKTQKEEPKKTVETKSNLPPLLTKKSVSYDPAVPLSPLVSNRYPETRRKGQMVAYTG
ncbi:hypothetical protein [Wolbachia pipientis]|uniref:hypothetical protein n=1 Tax=Wolbachia pipientis TaxID=955 RepID=UPI0021C193FC|nr:hypothetical protein [Wolbachia pipientis]